MRAIEFLIEYRQQIIKQFGPKLVQTFRAFHENQTVSDDTILGYLYNRFKSIDPSSNESYVLWLAKEYIRKNGAFGIQHNDLRNLLSLYHQYKKYPLFSQKFGENFKNIMNITIDDLLSVGNQLISFPRELEQSRIKLTPAYQDSKVVVYMPRTEAESCKYGANTKWCTAAENDNRFVEYFGEEPLYIIIPRAPKYPSEKYQFQINSADYKDDQNQDIRVGPFFDRFPDLWEWFKTQPNVLNSPVIWQEKFTRNVHNLASKFYKDEVDRKIGDLMDDERDEYEMVIYREYLDAFPDVNEFIDIAMDASDLEFLIDDIFNVILDHTSSSINQLGRTYGNRPNTVQKVKQNIMRIVDNTVRSAHKQLSES